MSDELAARVLRLVDQVNALADEIEYMRANARSEGEYDSGAQDAVRNLRAIARKAGRPEHRSGGHASVCRSCGQRATDSTAGRA